MKTNMTYAIIMIGVVIIGYFLLKSSGLGAAGGNFQTISAAEAKTLLKGKKALPLDVRTPNEMAQGKIKGAKGLNVSSPSFIKGLDKLDKTKSYLVYCRSGARSTRACRIMSSKGFENLYNLQGGFNGWN